MSTQAVLFDVQDQVAHLTLNLADRLNPLTPALMHGCLEALQRVEADTSVRCLLLSAAGRGFCVGADLTEFGHRAKHPEEGSLGNYVGDLMAHSGNPLIAGLRALSVPVVCAINGVAAGGGVGLALAGDMVIAARSAYFYLPFIPALGLVPDMGASWVLPRTVGRARAMGLALTGHKLSAQQAVDWGLIWSCVEDHELSDQARQLALQLAALPSHAIGEARALFAAAHEQGLPAQLDLERQRQQVLIERPSFAEGVAAFSQRRQPRFPGRD